MGTIVSLFNRPIALEAVIEIEIEAMLAMPLIPSNGLPKHRGISVLKSEQDKDT